MSYKDTFLKKRVSEKECGELSEKVVFINRVAKVVKGGRRFSFSALVVVGDGNGNVGFGLGKANEVPMAISKGTEAARKSMIRIPMSGVTLPHEAYGIFGPCKIMLRPGKPGTGVIAGAAVRAVMEMVGIKDVRSKVIGSNNPHNILQATINGLMDLKNPEEIAKLRKVSLEEMGYSPY